MNAETENNYTFPDWNKVLSKDFCLANWKELWEEIAKARNADEAEETDSDGEIENANYSLGLLPWTVEERRIFGNLTKYYYAFGP